MFENISITCETIDNIIGKKIKIKTNLCDFEKVSEDISNLLDNHNAGFFQIILKSKELNYEFFRNVYQPVFENSVNIPTKFSIDMKLEEFPCYLYIFLQDNNDIEKIYDLIIQHEFYHKLKEY